MLINTGSQDACFRAIFSVRGSVGFIGDEFDVVRENCQRTEKDTGKEAVKKTQSSIGPTIVIKKKVVRKISFLAVLLPPFVHVEVANCTISC